MVSHADVQNPAPCNGHRAHSGRPGGNGSGQISARSVDRRLGWHCSKTRGPGGRSIVRPLLAATHAEIEAYLRELGQDWREDSSNRNLSFTRNRIRHELLPLLEGWNPRLREHMAQMAALARDEEAWWQAELARLAPQLILPGRPVRGGGRAAGSGLDSELAIEVSRLAALAPALQRRLIRYAAEKFGAALDFSATEAVRALAVSGRAGQKLALPHGLRAERSARELRLSSSNESTPKEGRPEHRYEMAIPGEIDAPAFGLRLRVEFRGSATSSGPPNGRSRFACKIGHSAQLEARRQGQAALFGRTQKGEGSAGTDASYRDRSSAVAGAGDRWHDRLDARCGTRTPSGPSDFGRFFDAVKVTDRLRQRPHKAVNAQYPAPFVLWFALQLSPAREYNRVTASGAARDSCPREVFGIFATLPGAGASNGKVAFGQERITEVAVGISPSPRKGDVGELER